MADKKQLYTVTYMKKVDRNGEEKTYFDKIGYGFASKDGNGFNFWFETLPVGLTKDTMFHISPHKPKEKRESEGFSE